MYFLELIDFYKERWNIAHFSFFVLLSSRLNLLACAPSIVQSVISCTVSALGYWSYLLNYFNRKWTKWLVLLLHQRNEVNFEVHQLIAWQLGLLQCYLFANLGYSQVTILQSSTNNLDIAELANFLQLCILLWSGDWLSNQSP